MMDPLGLLLALAAVAIYPGAAFTGAIAAAVAWLGRLPPGERGWTAAEVPAAAAALLAASMAPLPGSPAQRLPPDTGPGGNLAVALLLLAVAAALGGDRSRSSWRTLAAAAGLLPALALAPAAGGLAMGTVAAVPGTLLGTARLLSVTALLVVAPLLASSHTPGVSRACRALVLASIQVVALALALRPGAAGAPDWAAPALVLGAAGVHAALLGLLRERIERLAPAVAGLAAVLAAAATTLALVSAA